MDPKKVLKAAAIILIPGLLTAYAAWRVVELVIRRKDDRTSRNDRSK